MLKEALKVGVLIVNGPGGVQFLDLSAVDVLGSCGSSFIRMAGLPDSLIAKARPIEVLYIAESGTGSHAETTSNGRVLITHSFETAGKLDYLVIPGPDPKYVASSAEQAFIRAKFAEVSAVLTICTGVLAAMQSGILSGLRVTAPRPIIPLLKKVAPDVEWVDRRWTVSDDGRVWSSGAVTNGNDMMAAFVRQSGVIDPLIADLVCAITDVGDRPQDYGCDIPEVLAAYFPPPV